MSAATLLPPDPADPGLRFSADAWRAVLRQCEDQWPREAVGLGFGPRDQAIHGSADVVSARGVRNIMGRPTDAYIAAPQDVIAALLDAAQRNETLRVIFHSHPGPRGGPVCANPSDSDVSQARLGSQAAWPGVAQLVVACAPGPTPDVPWRVATQAYTIDGAGRAQRSRTPSWEGPGGTLRRCAACHCFLDCSCSSSAATTPPAATRS